jgi:hypothetical protein
VTISHDTVSGGFAIFKDGIFKVAVVNTHHDTGVVIKGVVTLEKMPRSSWTIHYCSPAMHIEENEAVLQYIRDNFS